MMFRLSLRLGAAMLFLAFMGVANAMFVNYPNPTVSQRADAAIHKHTDGYYYMTASVPDYKRVEIRRSTTIAGLGNAATQTAFTAPASGTLSGWIWAPDIKFYDGAWYLYFSGSPSNAVFDQRLYWMRNTCANPMSCAWSAPQRFYTSWESFQLDGQSFEHNGVRYFLWAQNEPGIATNSNIYIARMNGATAITGSAVRIAVPTLAWEKLGGVAVNEGPQVVKKNGRIYVAYSASATDTNYKLGLLSSWDTANLLDPASWYKHPNPVFESANGIHGPGHGDFTVAEDGVTDLLVFHARPYDPPTPDALRDPNRHTRFQQLYWRDNGDPFFGQPLPTGMTAPGIRGQGSNRCVDDWQWNAADGAEVRLYDCTGSAAQEWEFAYVNGYYRIRNRHANKCLDNWQWGTAAGTDVRLYSCSGGATQDWSIVDRGNGLFALRARHSGLCLDAINFGTANGTDLHLWTCTYGNNQLWRRG